MTGRGWIAGVLLLAWTSPAALAEGLSASYRLSWAGLEIGEIEASVMQRGQAYRVAWQGRTTGLADTLFPFASAGSSEGRCRDGRFMSERFAGRSRWDDGVSTWRVAFAPDGRAAAVELSPEPSQQGREPVPPELRVAPDPMALLLTGMARAGPGVRVDGTSFDGRRATRFTLACAPAMAAGELACTVERRLLAGSSRRSSAAAREPARVWLRPDVRADAWWPVRAEVPTRVGTIKMWLVRAERHAHIEG